MYEYRVWIHDYLSGETSTDMAMVQIQILQQLETDKNHYPPFHIKFIF